MEQKAAFVLAGLLISWISFAVATELMYRLSVSILGPGRAFGQTILFVINPAGMFMTSVYTTSLFTMLSLAGIYAFYRDLTYTVKRNT
jgi:Gpi18-like mannosyltransferase